MLAEVIATPVASHALTGTFSCLMSLSSFPVAAGTLCISVGSLSRYPSVLLLSEALQEYTAIHINTSSSFSMGSAQCSECVLVHLLTNFTPPQQALQKVLPHCQIQQSHFLSFPVGRKMTRANFRQRACRATRSEVLLRGGTALKVEKHLCHWTCSENGGEEEKNCVKMFWGAVSFHPSVLIHSYTFVLQKETLASLLTWLHPQQHCESRTAGNPHHFHPIKLKGWINPNTYFWHLLTRLFLSVSSESDRRSSRAQVHLRPFHLRLPLPKHSAPLQPSDPIRGPTLLIKKFTPLPENPFLPLHSQMAAFFFVASAARPRSDCYETDR